MGLMEWALTVAEVSGRALLVGRSMDGLMLWAFLEG